MNDALSHFGYALLHEFSSIQRLLELGGWVLWSILGMSLLMWLLIIERYWFIWLSFPRRRLGLLSDWQARSEHSSWHAHRIRNGLIADAHIDLQTGLPVIRVLTEILPLLGLLGTVSGMIQTFDAINYFGHTQIQVLAAGIGEALLTTMAGLMTALSGLYFSSHLQRLSLRERDKTADLLTFD